MTFPAFDARILASAVAALGGRHYGGTGDATTDCVRGVEAILVGVYGPTVGAEHAALMVADPSQPFSPVDACLRLGIAEQVEAPVAGRWHVVQGWRVLDDRGWVPSPSPSPNGHCFLYYHPFSPYGGRGVVVEANVRRPWCREVAWDHQLAPYKAGVEFAALVESR